MLNGFSEEFHPRAKTHDPAQADSMVQDAMTVIRRQEIFEKKMAALSCQARVEHSTEQESTQPL